MDLASKRPRFRTVLSAGSTRRMRQFVGHHYRAALPRDSPRDLAHGRQSSGTTPQLARRDARAFGKRGELGPHDTRMDLARGREAGKTAIGTGDDPLASDHAGESADP